MAASFERRSTAIQEAVAAKRCPIQGEAGGSPSTIGNVITFLQVLLEIDRRVTCTAISSTSSDFQGRSPMDRRRPRNLPSRPLVLIVEGHEDTRAL
jgi:hypothetical protein